jgi:hypothetical protein
MNKKLVAFLSILFLSLSLPLIPVNAAAKAGGACKKAGITSVVSSKTFTCVKSGKKLVWDKGVAFTKPKSTSNAGASASKNVELPIEWSTCTKIGEKIVSANRTMRCSWAGHANTTEEALDRLVWRGGTVTKVSTSKSNNYSATPKEGAACSSSGDTFNVSGGILECRWIAGGKLQWIKINTIKKTFTNAISPVSIDACKLQNSSMTVARGNRDATQFAGFPLPKPDYMSVKGNN